jgi:hypothetical protein
MQIEQPRACQESEPRRKQNLFHFHRRRIDHSRGLLPYWLTPEQVAEVSQQIETEIKGHTPEDELWMSSLCAKSYNSVLTKWVRPRWERYRVKGFDHPTMRAAVEDWLQSLWRSQKNPKGLAPKTVRSIYSVMKLTFKFGVKWGYLSENPMAEQRASSCRAAPPNGSRNPCS